MKIADFSPQSQSERARAGFRILIRCFCMDPDLVFKFLWIRFQIFWIRIWIRFQPRFGKLQKVSKSDLSEENLKFMTKDRQKMKKATISY